MIVISEVCIGYWFDFKSYSIFVEKCIGVFILAAIRGMHQVGVMMLALGECSLNTSSSILITISVHALVLVWCVHAVD